MFVFVFCSYLSFIILLFKNKYPDFGNSKRLQQSIKSTRSITQGMSVVFCKDFLNSDGGKSMCCILVFCLIKWNNAINKIGSCELCGLKDL